MSLFSGLTKSGGDYQNIDAATCSEPPLVTATPVTASTTTSSLPTTSDSSIHTSKSNEQPPTTTRFPTPLPHCPHCQTPNITTRIRTYPSCETWALVILLFLVFWPVCWFPLVMDSCKMTDHYCTHCNEGVGRVKPLSDCCVKEMG